MARAFKDYQIVKDFVHKDKAKIINFIDLLLNKASELNKIENIDQRFAEAARQAGLNQDKHKEFIELTDERIKDLTFHYLSYYQHSNEFQQYFNDQMLYWNLQKELATSKKDDEEKEDFYDWKLKVSKQCDELLKRIKQRKNDIYDVEQVGQQVADIMDDKIRILRVEERIIKHSV